MIKLTNLQADFLLHRLSAPDAIAESFTDVPMDEEPEYTIEQFDEIVTAASDLLVAVESNKLLVPDSYSQLQRDIIIECFEGNTWFAGLRAECEDQNNHRKFQATERSIDTLADKLRGQGLNISSIPKL